MFGVYMMYTMMKMLQKVKLGWSWVMRIFKLKKKLGLQNSQPTQMMMEMSMPIPLSGLTFRSDKDQYTPIVSTAQSSGADLFATARVVIPPLGVALVPTGVFLTSCPEDAHYDIQVRPRSSALHRNGLLVQYGTIDQDYREEIKIVVYNTRREENYVGEGARIAQLVISERVKEWPEGIKVSGNIRKSGFGSTGQ